MNERVRVACVAIAGAESRGNEAATRGGRSTCIRDTAPCRTDEPLGEADFLPRRELPL